MEIIKNSEKRYSTEFPICAAIGFFDGVHIAHQKLLSLVHDYPGKKAVITFANSPSSFVKSKHEPDQIISLEDKLELFALMGIDIVFLYDFSTELMDMSPKDFIDMALVKQGIKKAIVGYNFRFGKGSSAGSEELTVLCSNVGIEAEIVNAVVKDGEVVSSSLIRKKLRSGNIDEANIILGRNFYIKGIIQEGKKLGRSIGFPTINTIVPKSLIVPKWGVYETYTTIGGERRHSITNVGNNPTIGSDNLSIETNIFDFDQDVYGQMAKIEFIEFIRPEMKFSGIDELVRQIASDIKSIKENEAKSMKG